MDTTSTPPPALAIACRLLDQTKAASIAGGGFRQVITHISQPMWEIYLEGIKALAGKEASKNVKRVGATETHIISSTALFAISFPRKV